jgi:hypothetical protein
MNTAITTTRNTPTETAIAARREAARDQRAMGALTRSERDVLTASTHRAMKDLDPQTLVKGVEQITRYASMLTGARLTEGETGAMTRTALTAILPRRFGELSMHELRLAFELLISGDLDADLPKNGATREADRAHYGQLTAEYVTKVLAAYQRFRARALQHAFSQSTIKQQSTMITPKEAAENAATTNAMIRRAFARYKYRGELDTLNAVFEQILLTQLQRAHVTSDVTTTEEDRRAAIRSITARAAAGLVNAYTFGDMRRRGWDCDEVRYATYAAARRREIGEAFDYMISNGLTAKTLVLQ